MTYVLDIEAVSLVPFAEGDPFPSPASWEIVCLCMLAINFDQGVPSIGHMFVTAGQPGYAEAAMMIESAIRALPRDRGKIDQPALVTFNGRSFDVPVLAFEAMRQSHASPFLIDMLQESRYPPSRYDYGKRIPGQRMHLDLADELSGFGASPKSSLDAVAKAIGFPGKGDVSGADVAALKAAGEIDRIVRYCQSDVYQEAAIWMRWLVLTGQIRIEDGRAAEQELRRRLDARRGSEENRRDATKDDIWAVAHGDKSTRQHLVDAMQLQTSQAALCGVSSDDACWEAPSIEPMSDRRRALSELPKCARCQAIITDKTLRAKKV